MTRWWQVEKSKLLFAGSIVCLVGGAILLWTGAAMAREASIDLRKGTLNGKPLPEWTLDEVTDAFGRPSAVTAGVGGIVGARLEYHTKGMSFWFRAKEKDPAQHLWIATVYLSRSWDADKSAWYSIFTGRLLPAVDMNWKQSQLLNEFASLNPKIETAEDAKKAFESSSLNETLEDSGFTGRDTDMVGVSIGHMEVGFHLESNTKFLERVVIIVEN